MRSFKNSLSAFALFAFAGALALVFCLGTPASAQEEINFGIISTESSQNLRTIWEPFLEDMEKQTGLKIRAFFATDYAGIIEGMRFNKVQLAWFGNKSAMEAVDRAQGEVFAQTVSADGSDGYYAVLIAHKDSPINNLDDLWKSASNMSFANGDPNSTSGFLVPGYYVFALNGKDPKTAFKRTIIGNHEANAMAVAGKQVDVATCNNENLARLEVTNPEKRKEIKIIWTSPLIPSDPLVWRKDLDPKVKKAFTDFLFTYGQDGDAKEAKVLSDLQWKGFKKSTDLQLIPIRELELYKEKTNLEKAQKITDADKKRMAEIDAALADLEKLKQS
ncbi:MAG: phosphonate ABC transporter substrate-binding protein [Deltaproteobacteria bacterium]|jgi:phosphonate transport system substrate-binding protein|nr:phosphonate ABC transporter substrate-binding protein [Deltaproteobacteria bacterium]